MPFNVLIQLNQSPCPSKDVSLDLFWHTAQFFSCPGPSWNGYMTSVSKGDYSGKVSVNMLLIIDMDPDNLFCICSTLNFIADHQSNLSIALLLNGFHTMMSFAGSIGALIHGSGLQTALECIYGKLTVSSLLSGKAIAKALQAHFLVESSLMKLLLKPFFPW